MNELFFLILILSALGLYCCKTLNESNRSKSWQTRLEAAARKALRFTMLGIGAFGLALLALFAFPLVSRIGYALFSERTVSFIRSLMDIVFDTRSVYIAIRILACIMLVAVEFSLVFSVLGFCVVKRLVFPHLMEYDRMQTVPECYQSYTEITTPRTFRKIFLTFANLRI